MTPEPKQLTKQDGLIIWFTGLSGAGKTTLSLKLENRLMEQGLHIYELDGDLIRMGLNSDLGFSLEDRRENIRRIGEVARLFTDADIVTIVAFISPLREDRERVKASLPVKQFVEIFVDCPLEICERRDTNVLYKKARKGEIKNFTGISSPYEPPLAPDIHINTDKESIDESTQIMMNYFNSKGYFLHKPNSQTH